MLIRVFIFALMKINICVQVSAFNSIHWMVRIRFSCGVCSHKLCSPNVILIVGFSVATDFKALPPGVSHSSSPSVHVFLHSYFMEMAMGSLQWIAPQGAWEMGKMSPLFYRNVVVRNC